MTRYYILTRFNLKLWSIDKHNQSTRSEQWLQRRFELFEKYCLPSIVTQTFKDFKWIVLFDENTPDSYKQRYRQYVSECPQLMPIEVPSKMSAYFAYVFQQAVLKDLAANGMGEGCKVVTTYLDNDDALSHDFMEQIDQYSQRVTRDTFITLHDGLQYFEEMNMATHVVYKNNHFITLIEIFEEGTELKTVYGYGGHGNVYRHPECEVIGISHKAKPSWVEVIHATNAKNDVLLHRPTSLVTDWMILKELFNVDIVLRNDARKIFYTQFIARTFKAYWAYFKVKIVGYDRLYKKRLANAKKQQNS